MVLVDVGHRHDGVHHISLLPPAVEPSLPPPVLSSDSVSCDGLQMRLCTSPALAGRGRLSQLSVCVQPMHFFLRRQAQDFRRAFSVQVHKQLQYLCVRTAANEYLKSGNLPPGDGNS